MASDTLPLLLTLFLSLPYSVSGLLAAKNCFVYKACRPCALPWRMPAAGGWCPGRPSPSFRVANFEKIFFNVNRRMWHSKIVSERSEGVIREIWRRKRPRKERKGTEDIKRMALRRKKITVQGPPSLILDIEGETVSVPSLGTHPSTRYTLK